MLPALPSFLILSVDFVWCFVMALRFVIFDVAGIKYDMVLPGIHGW
jgi:hypothetical protein